MRHKKFRFKFNTVSLCFLVAVTLVACRDFKDVRDLQEQANKIEKQSGEMATDFYASCMRRARIPRTRFPGITNTREVEEQKCRANTYPAITTIKDANAVLINYLRTLAKLAGDGSSVIESDNREALQRSLTSLPTALASAGVTVPEPVTAIAEQGAPILEAIFNAIADEIRQDTIVPVMVCTDPVVQDYTKGLEEIAAVVYVNQLRAEAEQQTKYFTELTPRIAGLDFPPSEALNALNLDRVYNDAIDQINARKEFAASFENVLVETRNAHERITLVFAQKLDLTQQKPATSSSNSEPEVEIVESKRQEFCDDRAVNSRSDQAALHLTPSDAEKIVNILKDYERATAPLLEKMNQVEFQPIESQPTEFDRMNAGESGAD